MASCLLNLNPSNQKVSQMNDRNRPVSRHIAYDIEKDEFWSIWERIVH